jgi:hypothetical protein
MANGEATEYNTLGPTGELMKNLGPRSLMKFRDGTSVFESRLFNVSPDRVPINLMARSNSIGERYLMSAKDIRGSPNMVYYQSRWRDTYLYDENADDLKKIPFREAWKYSKLFNEGGEAAVSDEFTHYVDKLRRDPNTTEQNKDDENPPHFMTTYDRDGLIAVADLVGQMQPHAFNKVDLIDVAITMLAKISSSDGAKERAIADDIVALVNEIERQTYDQTYWSEIIAENISDSVPGNDWVGEMTPPDMTDQGYPQVSEWKPNAYGSLKLPTADVGGVLPAGFANYPGLLTLSQEANKGNQWSELGKRARAAVEFIDRLVHLMRTALPTSSVTDAKNRQPWFHEPNAATTLFETAFSGPRDPIFITSLPILGRATTTSHISSLGDSKTISIGPTRVKFPIEAGRDPHLAPASELAENLIRGNASIELAFGELKKAMGGNESTLYAYMLANVTQWGVASLRKYIYALGTSSETGAKILTNLYSSDRKVVADAKKQFQSLVSGLAVDAENGYDYPIDVRHISGNPSSFDLKPKKSDSSPVKAGLIEKLAKKAESLGLKDLDLHDTSKLNGLSSDSEWKKLSSEYISAIAPSQMEETSIIKSRVDVGDRSSNSKFHRSPLTMSKKLAENLPIGSLIRQSDPATNHDRDLIGTAAKSMSLFGRAAYTDLDTLIKNPELRNLKDITVIAKTMAQEPVSNKRKASTQRQGSSKKRSQFVNVLDSDDEDESFGPRIVPDSGMDYEDNDAVLRNVDNRRREYATLYNGNLAHRYREANTITNPLLRACALVFIFSKNNGKLWDAMIENNIHVPIDLILWRIGIEHSMSNFILMKGGLNTGANLYGHANVADGADVVNKMVYNHVTWYSKAMVWRDQNIALIENIKPDKYLGGNNCKFITGPKDLENKSKNRPSIIVTAVPCGESEDYPKCMSITGHVQHPNFNSSMNGKDKCHYSSAYFYDSIYGFSKKANRDLGRHRFFDVPETINVIAFQGQQANYNTASGLFNKWVYCTGHRGMYGSVPGAAQVWNGAVAYFKEFDFTRLNLE